MGWDVLLEGMFLNVAVWLHFLPGVKGMMDYFCFSGFARLGVKATISCFFSILGKKLLCQEYQVICQKNV